MVRDFLLAQSKLILQDESGIPYRFIEPEKWDIKIYAKDRDLTKPVRLPFSFGYEQQSASSLMVRLAEVDLRPPWFQRQTPALETVSSSLTGSP